MRGCEIEGQVDKEGKLVSDEERLGFLPNTKGMECIVSLCCVSLAHDYQTLGVGGGNLL